MKIYEFRSDIQRVEDSSEPWLTVETELFSDKEAALEYMRSKAFEYETKEGKNNFYINVKDKINGDCIELDNNKNGDCYGIFEVTERELH